MCLGNISKKKLQTIQTKHKRISEYVCYFSVDYNAVDKSEILNNHIYLMVKNNAKWCFGLLNKCLLHYWVLVDP